jgi:hypothetical protein
VSWIEYFAISPCRSNIYIKIATKPVLTFLLSICYKMGRGRGSSRLSTAAPPVR